MVTPRSPFVAIADSLLDEPWPFDLKGALALLSCHMHARWRASGRKLSLEEVAQDHPVSIPDLMKITGKGRRDIALKSLRSLAEVTSMSAELRGEVVWINWPKWAEFNQTHSRSQGSLRAPPKPKPKPKPNKEEESRAPRAQPSAQREKKPPRKIHPEALRCSELLVDLLREVPGARIPSGARDRWARELERLVSEVPDLSGPGCWEQVEAGIRWALGPDNLGAEYEVVVRSAKSLREKWPRLVAAARRHRPLVDPGLRSLRDEWIKGA